jgi:hypothetical protein
MNDMIRYGRALLRRSGVRAALASAAMMAGAAAAWCQQPQQPVSAVEAPADQPRGGWALFNASAYSGFIHFGLPGGTGNYLLGGVPLGFDSQNGASFSAGYRHFSRRGSFTLLYEPSYYGMVRHSEWNSLNHSLSLRAAGRFAHRWDASFSAAATVRSLNGMLFAPGSLSTLVAAPGSSAEYASAVLAGRYANESLVSVLNGATVMESPLTAVLYSERVLSSSAMASLSYQYSRRLTVHFTGTGLRTQPLDMGQPAGAYSHGFLQRMTEGTGGVGLSYSVDPRTQFGLDASGGRYISDLIDNYVTRMSFSVGRRIGRRWFLQGTGGAAIITPLWERAHYAEGPQPTAHGSVGYRLATQSFMATADRTPATLYGTSGGYTLSTGGAWQWHRPHRAWQVSASLRQQRFSGGELQNLNGWMAGAAVYRTLGRHTGMQIDYSYMDNSGTYVSGLRNIKVHAVRVSGVWRGEGVE